MFRHWCPSLVVIAVSEPCVRWQGVVPLLVLKIISKAYWLSMIWWLLRGIERSVEGLLKSETREVKGRQSRAWKTSVRERSSGLVEK